MNSSLTQQQPTNGADSRLHNTTLPRRPLAIGPGELHGRYTSNKSALQHNGMSSGNHVDQNLAKETETKGQGSRETRTHKPNRGQPDLHLAEANEFQIRWDKGTERAPRHNQVQVKLELEVEPTAPFLKRAEAFHQQTVSKPPKDSRPQETTIKLSPRRPSATTRSGRTTAVVVRADRLDCTPWTGQRTEDRLSDQAIKTGQIEKAQVVNEVSTARPSLWPHLKNGTGIHGLSSLFTSVLQRREESGRITTASTFKPPPRVTLTDTKRELWLRDLANQLLPLRRLSRTIPHGIRGKPLLEQCLAKNVPMARAVWLARCVGANEIRAFRRKGISGAVMVDNEVKWVKDWTITVESFNQECIDRRDQPDWKLKVTYAIQLTSRFYAGGLLDKDHFLDWLLTNLERYSYDMLPLSLMFLHQYWSELTSSLKYGSRLATACFHRLSDLLSSAHKDLFHTVITRLQHLGRLLSLSHSSCVLLPKAWSSLQQAFESLKTGVDRATQLVLQQIAERNTRLIRAMSSGTGAELPKSASIVTILDTAKPPFSIQWLSSLCLSNALDLQDLVTTTMRWSCSAYRLGCYRVYLAAALLEDWVVQGLDVNECILQSLAMFRTDQGLRHRSVSRLIAELVRSQTFDASRYLRWLIATGALSNCQAEEEYMPCDVQILRDLPHHNMPSNVANLRLMLLRGIGIRNGGISDNEDEVRQTVKRLLTETQSVLRENSLTISADIQDALPTVSVSTAFELTDLIRQQVDAVLAFMSQEASLPPDVEIQSANPLARFMIYQTILEDLHDYRALDDVFHLVVMVADISMLTSIVCSLEYHLETHDAISSSSSLCEIILRRYRTFRLTCQPLQSIAGSLSRIFARLGSESDVLKYLDGELLMADQTLTSAAYTPISDIQVDASQSSGIDNDDLEYLITSGAAVDSPTVARVCSGLATRLQKHRNNDIAVVRQLVSKYRGCNEELFDNLAQEWLFARLGSLDPAASSKLATMLLDTGCITVAGLVRWAGEKFSIAAKRDVSEAAVVSINLLASLIPLHGARNAHKDQLEFFRDQPVLVLRFVRRSFYIDGPTKHPIACELLDNIVSNYYVLSVVNLLLLNDPTALYAEFDLPSLVAADCALIYARRLVMQILDPSYQLGLAHMAVGDIIIKLFELVDEICLPVVQFGLCFFSLASRQSADEQQVATSAVINGAKEAMSRNCALWPRLVSVVDKSITREIRKYAEKVLLEELLQPREVIEPLDQEREIREALQRYSRVIEATASSTVDNEEYEIGQIISNHLDSVTQEITNLVPGQPERGISLIPNKLVRADRLQHRIQMLLHLSLIHNRSFQHNDSGLSDRATFLCILSRLLVGNSARLTADTLEFIFDVATYFAPDLTPRELSQIHTDLGSVSQDPRIRFLFSFPSSANAWLHVTTSAAAQAEGLTTSSQQPQTSVPFQLRQWELLSDSTPNVGVNDTALSLRLFDARKV